MAEDLSETLEVIEAVQNQQWNFNRELKSFWKTSTKRYEDEAWWAEAAKDLVLAIPILAPTGPRGNKLDLIAFSDRRGPNMRGYTLHCVLEYTVIKRYGQEYGRHYDLVNSNEDRVELLRALVEIWKRREQSRLRNQQKRRTGSATKQLQVNKTGKQQTTAASMLLHRHTHRRLVRGGQKPQKPSPLGETSVNASPGLDKAFASKGDKLQEGEKTGNDIATENLG